MQISHCPYEVHPVQAKYQVEDLVMLYDSSTKVGQAKKLRPMWMGPFVVSEVCSPTLIKISSLKKDWVVHHDRLKPYHAVDMPLWVQRKRHALLSTNAKEQVTLQGKMSKGSKHLQDEPVYCTCHKPDNDRPMVCCDICDEWFHCDCVNIPEKVAIRLARYVCPICKSG
jgi:hypothetical protein